MPAPDVPPPPAHHISERPLFVHLHPRLLPPESVRSGVVIVIDALRASVTITAAIYHGAASVIPTLTVDDAMAHAQGLPRNGVILGGERGGVLIPGFDLDNSPTKYVPGLVNGKTVVFTTTNGTAALLHVRAASEILVGSFANVAAICDRVAKDPRPVHILCAGTRDEISMDDILPAGAMVEKLIATGRQLVSDDSGRVALATYRAAHAPPSGIVAAMRSSRGGRNLDKIGLGEDVDFCSRFDTLPVVPRFDPASGRITR